MSKTVEVSIMGQSYVLSCHEHEEAALRQAVDAVDREMCSIRDLGRVRARERIAVLAALNLAHAKLQGEALAPASSPSVEAAADSALTQQLQALQHKLDSVLGADAQLI